MPFSTIRFILPFLLAGFISANAQENFTTDPFAQFGTVKGQEVTADLVTEGSTFQPGETFTVALKLVHSGEWHTYGANPGVAGTPTSIKWTLPEGFEAGPIQWPVPHSKDDVLGRTNYYDGTVFLLTDISAPESITPGESIEINALAKWLRCAETCVPGKAELSATLTSSDDAVATDPDFQKTRDEQPATSEALSVAIADEGDNVTITVSPTGEINGDPGEVSIFHTDRKLFKEPSVKAKKSGKDFVATLEKTKDAGDVPEVTGFAHASNGWLSDGSLKSLALSADSVGAAQVVEAAPGLASAFLFPSEVTPDQESAMKEILSWGVVDLSGAAEEKKPFLIILVFAFLGGMILNLMPCVFPVLGIKIMGFVSQSGEDKRRIKLHGLAFGAGVLLSMLVLVGVLLAVKAGADDSVVWGEQLRQPWFVAAMIAIIFAFGLSLAGVFEIGMSLSSAGGQLQNKKGLSGSFFFRTAHRAHRIALHRPLYGPGDQLCVQPNRPDHAPRLRGTGSRTCIPLRPSQLLSRSHPETAQTGPVDGNVQTIHGVSVVCHSGMAPRGLRAPGGPFRDSVDAGCHAHPGLRPLDLRPIRNPAENSGRSLGRAHRRSGMHRNELPRGKGSNQKRRTPRRRRQRKRHDRVPWDRMGTALSDQNRRAPQQRKDDLPRFHGRLVSAMPNQRTVCPCLEKEIRRGKRGHDDRRNDGSGQ